VWRRAWRPLATSAALSASAGAAGAARRAPLPLWARVRVTAACPALPPLQLAVAPESGRRGGEPPHSAVRRASVLLTVPSDRALPDILVFKHAAASVRLFARSLHRSEQRCRLVSPFATGASRSCASDPAQCTPSWRAPQQSDVQRAYSKGACHVEPVPKAAPSELTAIRGPAERARLERRQARGRRRPPVARAVPARLQYAAPRRDGRHVARAVQARPRTACSKSHTKRFPRDSCGRSAPPPVASGVHCAEPACVTKSVVG